MKYYTPQHKQLTLDLVRSSLDSLDKSNRWVMMGDLLPWADIEKEYNSRLGNKEKGARNKPPGIWQFIMNMVTHRGYVCTPVLVARD